MFRMYQGCLLLVYVCFFVSVGSAQNPTPLEILANRGDFTQWVAWIETAGLSDMLHDADALTIFAPRNAAFEAMPDAVMAYLTQDKKRLTRLITYHLMSGAIPAADMTTMQAASLEMPAPDEAVLGSTLNITVDANGKHVDGATLIETDIAAGSSVIHAIDAVLIPTFDLPDVDPLEVTGDMTAAGSSTVFPLTERMAELFSEEGYADTMMMDSIGTGAGFERFCVAAETDIANASRAIREEEIASCENNGRTPIEFRVGTDALAIVVSAENDFLTDLTLPELAQIYSGQAVLWSDVRPEFPTEPIVLYSPGTDSGTFDYFVEEIFSDDDRLIRASGAQFSENDNVLVQGVESSPYAMGYFGYAYYQANQAGLKILSINGVMPTETTAEDGTYPLARPLYIYSAAHIITEKPQVGAFITFYLNEVNNEILDVGYFPASKRALNLAKLALLAAMG